MVTWEKAGILAQFGQAERTKTHVLSRFRISETRMHLTSVAGGGGCHVHAIICVCVEGQVGSVTVVHAAITAVYS